MAHEPAPDVRDRVRCSDRGCSTGTNGPYRATRGEVGRRRQKGEPRRHWRSVSRGGRVWVLMAGGPQVGEMVAGGCHDDTTRHIVGRGERGRAPVQPFRPSRGTTRSPSESRPAATPRAPRALPPLLPTRVVRPLGPIKMTCSRRPRRLANTSGRRARTVPPMLPERAIRVTVGHRMFPEQREHALP